MTTRKQAAQGKRSRDVSSSLTKKAPPTPTRSALTVTATAKGFHGGQRKHVGDVFTLASEQEFSAKWMKRGDAPSVSGQAETAASPKSGGASSGDPLGD